MAQEVNNVRFGNYSIGNSQSGKPKAKEGEVNQGSTSVAQEQTQSKFNPDGVMNALGAMGAYNLISINKADTQAINPSDYLDEGRISDIEAMMAEFEAGVNEYAVVLEEEFSGALTQPQINALAAQMYADSDLL